MKFELMKHNMLEILKDKLIRYKEEESTNIFSNIDPKNITLSPLNTPNKILEKSGKLDRSPSFSYLEDDENQPSGRTNITNIYNKMKNEVKKTLLVKQRVQLLRKIQKSKNFILS